MEFDEAKRSWLPLVTTTAFVVTISSAPLPLWMLILVMGYIAFVMYAQMFYTRSLARSFWLSTFLHPNSPIRPYLRHTVWLRTIAAIIAIPLSLLTYISVFGYSTWECFAVSIAVFCARQIHSSISSPVNANIADHLVELAHLRIYYWFAILLVLAALAAVGIARGFSADYSAMTSDQIATQTISEVKHPVQFVEHCVRTIRFTELQLLRIRDINGWPYGWFIYLFFLIPNALPAFGVVTLFAGTERLLQLRFQK